MISLPKHIKGPAFTSHAGARYLLAMQSGKLKVWKLTGAEWELDDSITPYPNVYESMPKLRLVA